MPFACASWLVYFIDIRSSCDDRSAPLQAARSLSFEPDTLRQALEFRCGATARAENVLLNGKLICSLVPDFLGRQSRPQASAPLSCCRCRRATPSPVRLPALTEHGLATERFCFPTERPSGSAARPTTRATAMGWA